jgi:hypothetical protein
MGLYAKYQEGPHISLFKQKNNTRKEILEGKTHQPYKIMFSTGH